MSSKTNGAVLHWFPVYFSRWLASKAVSGMLPEQEGAFFRLLCIAMGDGTQEPHLDDDDDALALQSRLGDRWGKLGAKVRKQFTKRDGKLYNEVLSEVWKAQQAKHKNAVNRGKKGGRKKTSLSSALANPVVEPKQEVKQQPLTLKGSSTTLPPSKSGSGAGAGAAEAPRAARNSGFEPIGSVLDRVLPKAVNA